jgi:small subunit ribosomal protein S6
MKSTNLNHYELIIILKSDLNEEAENAFLKKINDIIKNYEGTVEKFDPWGKKRLSYNIKRESKGVYFYWFFKALPNVIAEIERNLRITDQVLRYLTIRIQPNEVASIEKFHKPKDDEQHDLMDNAEVEMVAEEI